MALTQKQKETMRNKVDALIAAGIEKDKTADAIIRDITLDKTILELAGYLGLPNNPGIIPELRENAEYELKKVGEIIDDVAERYNKSFGKPKEEQKIRMALYKTKEALKKALPFMEKIANSRREKTIDFIVDKTSQAMPVVKGLIKRMEKVESSAETAQYITNKIIEEGLVRDPRIKAANLVMVGVQPAKFRQVEVNAQEFNGHDSDTVDDLDELFPNVTDGNRPQVARDHLITPLTNRQRELYRFLESIRPTASLAHGYLNKIRHGLERGDFAQANRILDEPLDVPTRYVEAGDYMPN